MHLFYCELASASGSTRVVDVWYGLMYYISINSFTEYTKQRSLSTLVREARKGSAHSTSQKNLALIKIIVSTLLFQL